MPGSLYLQGSDLATYGVPNATTQQITAASALVDAYLRRAEGLQWSPDYSGAPCYMTAASPTLSFTLPSSIAAGSNVSINVPTFASAIGGVGEVVILDRSNALAVEACVIGAVTANTITLTSVANAHLSGATVEYGMALCEQRSMPAKRSITRLSRRPIARLLSGLGSYRYGRRNDQSAGLYDDRAILALIQTFGGPPEWIPWSPIAADFNAITSEIWVPSGIFLAYYSDVRVWYVAGFPQAGIPPPVKSACAAIINGQLATSDLSGGVKVAKLGQNSVQRFEATVLDNDMRELLRPYRVMQFE